MLRVLDMQRDGERLVLDAQNLQPVDEPAVQFPLAGMTRSFPITAARAFPLTGQQRTYP